jgi:hypothetical protein
MELPYNRPMGLLWFRRSKSKETPPAPEAPPVEPPAAPPAAAMPPPMPPAMTAQVRVPLRLRGLLLLNLKPDDGLEQIETAPPLGRRDEVIMALQGVAPGMSFDAAGRADYVAEDYRLTIDLGPGNPVHTAVAAAEGDTGVELLRAVMEREGWRAYVPKAGVFVEPDALDLFGLSDDIVPKSRI